MKRETPDIRNLLPLRINNATTIYFQNEDKRQNFIDKYFDKANNKFIMTGLKTIIMRYF